MRTLTVNETAVVSGGLQEVVVPGKRIKEGVIVITDPMAMQSLLDRLNARTGSSGMGGGGVTLEEVSVTAHKMTEQEKLAYDAAAKRAEANLLFVEALGVGVGAWLSSLASAVQKGILAAAGYVPGKLYVGEARAELLQRMTEMEYTLDGLDGAYDGKVDDEKYRFNI